MKRRANRRLSVPSRAKRKRREDVKGVLILTGSVLLLGGLLGMFFYRGWTKQTFDRDTLCPSSGPKAITAVIVDDTDEVSEVQREALKNRLVRLKDGLADHEKLTIYSIAGSQREVRMPAIEICNPGRGLKANPLTENEKLIRKRWTEGFSAKVDQVLDGMLSPQAERFSPIMETIQSVGVTTFGKEARDIPRHLLVISDMLHNTPEFSQYRDRMSFEDFQLTPYYSKVACQLAGVEVTILYLGRDGARHLQNREHIDFWQKYLASMNGRLVSAERIEG